MLTHQIETRPAVTPRWWAVLDARARNERNMSLWSEHQRARAAQVQVLCQLYYHARGFYISYGRLGISVKVDGARVRDQKGLDQFEQSLQAQGICKKVSAQGVIYRLVF